MRAMLKSIRRGFTWLLLRPSGVGQEILEPTTSDVLVRLLQVCKLLLSDVFRSPKWLVGEMESCEQVPIILLVL